MSNSGKVLSEGSARLYGRLWRYWGEFCSDRGADPNNADYGTYVALLDAAEQGALPGTRGGGPAKPAAVKTFLSAVNHHLGLAGRHPAYRARQAEWDTLVAGYDTRNRAPTGRVRTALTGAQAGRLANPDVPLDSRWAPLAARLILAMGAGERPGLGWTLASLHDDGSSVSYRLPSGVEGAAPHTHPAAAGTPGGWGLTCPACFLTRLRAVHGPGTVLDGEHQDRVTFRKHRLPLFAALSWDSGRRPVLPAGQASREGVWELAAAAGLTHGVVAPFTQALILGAWALGVNAASGVDGLRLGDVWTSPAGQEPVRVRVGDGAHPVTVGGAEVFGAGPALARWLRICTAAGLGDQEPLFPALHSGGTAPKQGGRLSSVRSRLTYLSELRGWADVGEELTLKSPEYGAAEASSSPYGGAE